MYLDRNNLSAMSNIHCRWQRHTKEGGGGVAKKGNDRRVQNKLSAVYSVVSTGAPPEHRSLALGRPGLIPDQVSHSSVTLSILWQL